MQSPKPPVVCEDGFTMSVQGNEFVYCTPRVDNAPFYTHYEVGFPSAKEPLLMPYAEDKSKPTQTVYGWVPVEVIVKIIKKHGGLKGYGVRKVERTLTITIKPRENDQ